MTLELAAPFQSDDKQPIFTVFNQLKQEMDYCRLAYLNEKLEQIYIKNPELPQINVHVFRHTHASLLFAAGASIKDVQTQLGHMAIKTTSFIIKWLPNKTRQISIEDILFSHRINNIRLTLV